MRANAVNGIPTLDAVTLCVSGEVDLEVADQFCDLIVGSGDPQTTTVVLDLTEVTFLGSPGISALITARRILEARGVRLCIDECSHIVERVLEVSGVLDTFAHSTDDLVVD